MTKETKDSQTFTLRQAKEMLNKVPEDLLDQPLRWWGEDEGGECKLMVLDDTYVNPTGDGYETLTSYTNEDQENEDLANEADAIPKGTVLVDLMIKPKNGRYA